jgi:hypothetical protein
VRGIERLVLLQLAEEIGAQAHHRAQARVAQAFGDELRETAALALLGAHVKLLALVDVDEEDRRLGLAQLLQPALGRVEQIAQPGPAFDQAVDPLGLPRCEARVRGIELPQPNERLDQRPDRLRPRLQSEEAPAPAVVKDLRPGGGGFRRIDPILPHQRRQHARLRERGFADPRIAQQDGKLVRRRGQRADHLGGLTAAAEEEVRVGFRHGGKAAVGRGVPPQLARRRTASGGCVHKLCDARRRRRLGGDDPMQLAQEGQSGRGHTGSLEQQQDQGEARLLHAAAIGLVILDRLPRAEPLLADQEHEGRGLGNVFGERRHPIRAGAQAFGREEDRSVWLRAGKLRRERLRQLEFLRVIA